MNVLCVSVHIVSVAGLEDSYLSHLKPIKKSMNSLEPVLLFSKGCQASQLSSSGACLEKKVISLQTCGQG